MLISKTSFFLYFVDPTYINDILKINKNLKGIFYHENKNLVKIDRDLENLKKED